MSDFKASSTLDLKRPDPAKPTDPTKLDKHGASGSTCLDSIDNKPSISTPLESNSTVSFAASTSKTGHAKGKAKAKAKGKAKTKAAVASSSSAGDKAPAEDSVCNVFCYRFFVGGGELPNSLSLFPHFCFFAHTLKKRPETRPAGLQALLLADAPRTAERASCWMGTCQGRSGSGAGGRFC
eukprot:GEMP01077324.1.p1 GENE.GEMP01077324.1~~GEMP01077324.1.p1  ORF type:complete len:181 (+),score=29.94 GEMP01077324.1:98-640(+)